MVVIQVLKLELYSEHGGTVKKLTNLPFKDRVSLFKQLIDFCLMIKYLGLSNEQIKKTIVAVQNPSGSNLPRH